MKEQRRNERVASRLRCWCEAEGVTFFARVANLGEGGVFLRTLTPLPPGARTRLRFLLMGERELALEATVVWARNDASAGPPGMGLAFDALDAEGQARVRTLFDREHSSASGRATALVVGPAGV